MAGPNEIENANDDDGSSTEQLIDIASITGIDVNDDLTTSLTKSLASPTVTPSKTQQQYQHQQHRPATPQSVTSNHSISNINTKMASSDGYSTNSNPYADSINSNSNPYADSINSSNNDNNSDPASASYQTNNNNKSKTMEVTVTVLSLHGILAKKNHSSIKKQRKLQKKKLKKRQQRQQRQQGGNNGGYAGNNHAEIDRPTATIVASFSQNISQERVFLTHVPSLPVSLLAAPVTPASPSLSSSSGATTMVYGSSFAPSSPGTSPPRNNNNIGGKSPKSPGKGGLGSNGNNNNEMIRPVVHWSSMDASDVEAGNALSTLQFRRKFVREGLGTNNGTTTTAAADSIANNINININNNMANRYVPQVCPINLSISRNGKMALLGKVDLIINGEERGRTSVTVPITSSIRRSSKSAVVGNPVKKVKKIRNLGNLGKSSSSSSSNANNNENNNANAPMVRIKGDTYHFGLDGGAMLRMIVHVHDPDEVEEDDDDPILNIPEDEEMDYYDDRRRRRDNNGRPYDDDDDDLDDDDSISDNESNDSMSDNEGALSVEGDDPSILERDDYFNSLAIHNSELHTLRSQLARSEQTNGVLQMELANAQHAAQCGMSHQYERERLALQLSMASESMASMERELNVARGESEALPIYERRVTELLEDLRKRDGEVGELQKELERRDLEVECLREEIGQLNRRYKRQLVDSLLWDADDDGGGGGLGAKDAVVVNNGNNSNNNDDDGKKSSEETRVDSPTSEGSGGGEGMLNKWGVRKLGKALNNAVSEEKGDDDVNDEDALPKDETTSRDATLEESRPSKNDDDENASPKPSSVENDDDGAIGRTSEIDQLGEREDPTEDFDDVVDAEGKTQTHDDHDGSFSLATALTPPRKERTRKPWKKRDVDDDEYDDDELVYASWKQVGTTTAGDGGAPSNAIDEFDYTAKNEPWALLKEETAEASSSRGPDNDNNNVDDEYENNASSSSSSKQPRGWGIRGLGASLLVMEERMRERQQLFQEQQQRELEKAAERQRAKDASAKGLGDVLISRFSNHGARVAAAGTNTTSISTVPSPPGTSVGSLEENDAEETDEELAEIEKASSGHAGGGSSEGEDGDGSKASSSDRTEDAGDDAVEEEGKVVTADAATVPEEGVTKEGVEPVVLPSSTDESKRGDARETLPTEGAEAAEDGTSSTPPEDANGGLVPIAPVILEAASSLRDGAESAKGSGGDENDRRGVGGDDDDGSARVDGDGSAIEGDGVSKERGVQLLDTNTDVAEVEEETIMQEKENDGKGTVGENAIVSSTDEAAESTSQSNANDEDGCGGENQDTPCASDGASKLEKEADGSKGEPRGLHSKEVEVEEDASPEKPMASASNAAIADDASPEESGEGAATTAAAAEIPPSPEDADDDAKPKKRRWGVRGLGARLKGMEGKMKERQRLFREQQQREFEEAERQRALDAAAAANQLGLGGALISRLSTHGSNPVSTTTTTSPVSDSIVVEECAEEGGDEIVKEQKEDSSPSQSSGANDDEDKPAKSEDSKLLMVDDSLDDVLTEEARQHRAKTNQALLLESMDMLEEELMSGIINNATETGTTDDAVSKENASRTLSTDRPPNEITEEAAPSKTVDVAVNSAEGDGDGSNDEADNAGLAFHVLTEAMDKSVREIVEEIEETLSTPSKGAIDDADEPVASLSKSIPLSPDDSSADRGQALREGSVDETKKQLTYEDGKETDRGTAKQDQCPSKTCETESRDENCTSASSCDEEAGCEPSSANSPDADAIDGGKDRITFDSPRSIAAPLANNE